MEHKKMKITHKGTDRMTENSRTEKNFFINKIIKQI